MSEEILDRSSLGYADKKAIDDIVKKDPTALTDLEKSTLRARRMYLSPVESAMFESVLSVKVKYADMKNDDLVSILKDRSIEIPESATKKADYVALLESDDVKREK